MSPSTVLFALLKARRESFVGLVVVLLDIARTQRFELMHPTRATASKLFHDIRNLVFFSTEPGISCRPRT